MHILNTKVMTFEAMHLVQTCIKDFVVSTLFVNGVWKFEVVVFCIVMPCSDVVGYQRFRGPYCFCLQGEVVF